MKWFLGILLFIGLIQSLLSLKDSKIKGSFGYIIKVAYLVAFAIGVYVMISQEDEDTYFNNVTEKMSKRVASIDSISSNQINILNSNIERTQQIIIKIDSVEKRTSKLLDYEIGLLKQYELVNKKLRSQIELEKSQLFERNAIIDLNDTNVYLEYKPDSSSYSIRACLTNIGKRVAKIERGRGVVLLFDSKNKPTGHLAIQGKSKQQDLLDPYSERGASFCYFSHGIFNPLQSIKQSVDFAVIVLDITYSDVLLKNKVNKSYYVLWIPETGVFGGPKDWQVSLTEKWIKENNYFK